MNLNRIRNIIEEMSTERFRFTPARRVWIDKKNGRKRPLGIPNFKDKLVQEVLRGLLDTYESERRPFAVAVNDDATRNLSVRGDSRPEQFSNRGRVLGISYDSTAIVPDGSDLPTVTNPVIDYAPTARPGSRAPHMWLWRDEQQISTLDLYDTRFVLLTGPSGQAWRVAGEKVAERLGIPLDCYAVGPGGSLIDTTGEWPSLYGVGRDGAVLVRPDGHVAWRTETTDANPATKLTAAFGRILSLD